MSSLGSIISTAALISLGITQQAHQAHHADASPPEPPKLYDTLRALKHPRGVDQALNYLATLSRAELNTIRVARLQRALVELSCPADAALKDHTEISPESPTNKRPTDGSRADDEPERALRATTRALKALSLLEKLREVTEPLTCLRAQWERAAKPTRASLMSGHTYVDLIARRASATLARLGRVDLLSGATEHPDPEVRASAARAGADPKRLCALHEDSWPLVKRAAIRGLGRIAGPESACLIHYLKAPTLSTRLETLRELGRLSDQPWARSDSELVSGVQLALQRHFKRQKIKLTERRATLTALARWRVTREAEQLLALHLRDGSLEQLSGAALYAILVAASLDQRLARLNLLLGVKRSVTLNVAIARSLIDRRLSWSALTSDGQRARLDLLKRAIEQLPRRGDARLVRDLQRAYLELYQHLNPRSRPESGLRDLAPSLAEEDDRSL